MLQKSTGIKQWLCLLACFHMGLTCRVELPYKLSIVFTTSSEMCFDNRAGVTPKPACRQHSTRCSGADRATFAKPCLCIARSVKNMAGCFTTTTRMKAALACCQRGTASD